MKRITVIVLLFIINVIQANASDLTPVYLEDQSDTSLRIESCHPSCLKKYDVNTDTDFLKINESNKNYQYNTPFSSQSFSFAKEKKQGSFTFGSKYDTTLSANQYTQYNTYYTKYQKNRFSFSSAYKNNALTPLSHAGSGTFMFTPEYKLNNYISIQNIYSSSFLDKSRKNELLFNITPFKDDRMNFNAGVSQIYSNYTIPSRSQVNFSTKINF